MSDAEGTGKANLTPDQATLAWPCRVPWCVARARVGGWPGGRERVIRMHLRNRTGEWCSKHVAAARALGVAAPKEPAAT